MTQPLLGYRDFSLEFPTPEGPAKALDRGSITVGAGEIVGLVGESGSGKSVAAMSAMRLLPRGAYRVTGGSLNVFGRDVMAMDARDLEALRGAEIGMIFQEPMNALNPAIRVGEQIAAVLRRHKRLGRAEASAEAERLLGDMLIADPAVVMKLYPAALSGGMRQRVLIAMAFACKPRLLIADEPTTALDVTVQAQVLSIIRDRARALGTAVLFISHDMAVVGQLCDRLYVLYAGTVVESGPTQAVLAAPRHPYTRVLLAALPDGHPPRSELAAIPGSVPSLVDPPEGCRFRPRCARAADDCTRRPPLGEAPHAAACWHPEIAA
ncbi:ABC transporter ATP-binding protein [Sphingosinicella microcystinivorans]|uniref:ABC transporter ATP-binding protein n=1 Tax=Sphingosinicella microcystinivorans TaxID=335406 RepID=UPI0022F3E1C1|nr:ABC transporter ATP-binding protein [Sphingosinicella microcystinivorans]WBX84363.1 ABC transporter ATP-binding protein [Sphingosinicella microcystinivorans]